MTKETFRAFTIFRWLLFEFLGVHNTEGKSPTTR